MAMVMATRTPGNAWHPRPKRGRFTLTCPTDVGGRKPRRPSAEFERHPMRSAWTIAKQQESAMPEQSRDRHSRPVP